MGLKTPFVPGTEVVLSTSEGMFFPGSGEGIELTTVPVRALPSLQVQRGPALCVPTILPLLYKVASGALKPHVPPVPQVEICTPLRVAVHVGEA